MVKARLAGMDKSLSEAARDLERAIGVLSLILRYPDFPCHCFRNDIIFAMSFDDVVISMFVTGVNTNTLPLRIYTQLKTE